MNKYKNVINKYDTRFYKSSCINAWLTEPNQMIRSKGMIKQSKRLFNNELLNHGLRWLVQKQIFSGTAVFETLLFDQNYNTVENKSCSLGFELLKS